MGNEIIITGDNSNVISRIDGNVNVNQVAELLSRQCQNKQQKYNLAMSLLELTGSNSLDSAIREKVLEICKILVSYPTNSVEVNTYAQSTGMQNFSESSTEITASRLMSYVSARGQGGSSVVSSSVKVSIQK